MDNFKGDFLFFLHPQIQDFQTVQNVSRSNIVIY